LSLLAALLALVAVVADGAAAATAQAQSRALARLADASSGAVTARRDAAVVPRVLVRMKVPVEALGARLKRGTKVNVVISRGRRR